MAKDPNVVTTLFHVPENVEILGPVATASVRTRGAIPTLLSQVKAHTVGGKIGILSKLIRKMEKDIINDLNLQARQMGADAVIGVKFMPYPLPTGEIGIAAIGTAVKLKGRGAGKSKPAELIGDEEGMMPLKAAMDKLATGSHTGKHKSFLDKDYPAKAKEIYKALKRDHPNMPKEVRARIALRKAKKSPVSRKPPETGGPKYKAPLHYKRRKGRYVKASTLLEDRLRKIARRVIRYRLANLNDDDDDEDDDYWEVSLPMLALALGGLGGGGYLLYRYLSGGKTPPATTKPPQQQQTQQKTPQQQQTQQEQQPGPSPDLNKQISELRKIIEPHLGFKSREGVTISQPDLKNLDPDKIRAREKELFPEKDVEAYTPKFNRLLNLLFGKRFRPERFRARVQPIQPRQRPQERAKPSAPAQPLEHMKPAPNLPDYYKPPTESEMFEEFQKLIGPQIGLRPKPAPTKPPANYKPPAKPPANYKPVPIYPHRLSARDLMKTIERLRQLEGRSSPGFRVVIPQGR